MKKIIFSLILVIVLAFGGFWWIRAYHLKGLLTSAIQEKKSAYSIHYDDMKYRGFPFTVGVQIKNPRIKEPQTNTEIALDGTLTVSTSLLGKEGWVDLSGQTSISSPNAAPWVLSGDLRLQHNSLDRFFELTKQLDQLKTAPPSIAAASFWGAFRKVSLQANKLALTRIYAGQEELVGEIKSADFHLKSKMKRDTNFSTLSFKIDLKDYELHQKELLYLSQLLKGSTLFSSTSYGKGSCFLEMSVGCTLANSEEFSFEESLPFFVDVKKSVISDAFSTARAAGKLKIEKNQEGHLQGHFAINSSSGFKGNGSHSFEDLLAVSSPLTPLFNAYPLIGQFVKNYRTEIIALAPDYSSFGPCNSQVDAHFQVKKEESSQEWENWDVQLHQFALSSDGYDLTLQGTLSPLAADLRIKLTNHQTLLRDLANYYTRWRTLLTQAQVVSERKLPVITDRVIDRTARFLESLSFQDPLTVAIEYRGPDRLKIGSFTPQELAATLSELGVEMAPEMFPSLRL